MLKIEDINEKKRQFILISIILAVFLVFMARLIDWQIIHGKEYREKADKSNYYTVETEAKRGEILDINGNSLAINESGYKIVIDKLYIVKGTENEIILKLIDIADKKKEKWNDVLPISLDSESNFVFMNDKEKDIESLKKSLYLNNYATAQNCMDKLIEKYKLQDYSKEVQRNLSSVRYNMTISGYDTSMTIPYSFADNVSPETVSIISEKSRDIRGALIRSSSLRKYVNGATAPHIVGTIGKISQEEYEDLKDTYSIDDTIGKNGIEGAMENYLKGEGGSQFVEATSTGSVLNVVETKNASPGNTVFLTIDSKLQDVANNSLKTNIESAKKNSASDCKSGAVVVLNVKDFSVLAAATYPSYDLDKYMNDNSYYNSLVTDEVNTPLVNRAFNGAFTPGSVYKPVVACAALQENAIKLDDKIYCNRVYDYYADSGFYIRCMGSHGSISVKEALAKSCNVFFAETGRRLGIEKLNLYAKRFGFGQKTGIEIFESSGILAGPEYSNSVGSTWYDGNTSQAAIGQSDNMFTPIQLATYTATIANGGNRYKTHLIRKITDYTRQNIVMENDPEKPELIETSGISPENIKSVQEGMRSVVTSGTATQFSNYPVAIAAKTGTAENSGSDHTTFVCFAPYENPEIAISVVIEHGKSGTWSKNVAKDILDTYFAKDKAN